MSHSRLWQGLSFPFQGQKNPLEQKIAAVEDSIWLRGFVQALVIVGILATDTAAGTWNSLWAVPLSILGAVWSSHRRRQRNIPVKFCIALGMILVLVLFLGRLISRSDDSRVILTELLIQLQVLHSFDLPRRKDLGYSTVIGIILLGVAATLSQTTTYGLFLLAFLAIALPVLVLDYRSRLGLVSLQLRGLGLSPRQLGPVLLAVLGLGLLIFALTPRLPGYQIRNLPVSAAIRFDGQFDGQRVINPGYMLPSARKSGTGSGQGNGTIEDTVIDPNFYYGFNSEINQNMRGTMLPKVIMRVRSQAAGFWRVLAFDEYTGRGWRISRNSKPEILRRSPFSYYFVMPKLDPTLLAPSKEVVQTFSFTAEFTNLIPALALPRELYFPTQEVALDPEGGLRSPVTLDEGLTYSVISDVPFRDRTQLGQAPTRYPKPIQQQYLQLPAGVGERIRPQAEALLANANRPLNSAYEQALFLAQALKQKYSLQGDLPLLTPGEDLVESFLLQSGGYPDHFSTALTVMLRSLGIPARLVTGLGTGEFNPFTGLYVVKNTDAFALTEVYFPTMGWFAFDPIPGHPLVPPSVEIDQTFSVLQQFWNWVAGWLPSPIAGFLAGMFALLGTAIASFFGLFSGGFTGLLLVALILAGMAGLLWLGWVSWQEWRYRRWLWGLAPMARLYQQMLDWLSRHGWEKHPAQTPLEYVQNIRSTATAPCSEAVTDISQAYLLWRYGGQAPDLPQLRRQFYNLQRIRFQPQSSGSRWQRFWKPKRSQSHP
jgi:protein-glutamine gamma-glutamyltransferase